MKTNPCIFTGIASIAEVPVEWECSKEMFARLILLLLGVTAPAIHRLNPAGLEEGLDGPASPSERQADR